MKNGMVILFDVFGAGSGGGSKKLSLVCNGKTTDATGLSGQALLDKCVDLARAQGWDKFDVKCGNTVLTETALLNSEFDGSRLDIVRFNEAN